MPAQAKGMAKGEVAINRDECFGCGYCVEFCPKDCIVMGEEINDLGYIVPEVVRPENCTACAVCAWMCPQSVIEVYRLRPG